MEDIPCSQMGRLYPARMAPTCRFGATPTSTPAVFFVDSDKQSLMQGAQKSWSNLEKQEQSRKASEFPQKGAKIAYRIGEHFLQVTYLIPKSTELYTVWYVNYIFWLYQKYTKNN